ncbi:hypothetical protein [Caballeronia cordobensis]|uniref:hypothetical protein n=1 Tax=Caballeronia cordobensis TaxID=1353886 RepID=UPI001186C600
MFNQPGDTAVNTQTIPGSAGMSALPLIVAVEDLAGAAYLGQMRALVVQRQAALGRFFADPAASAQIEAAQADLRRHVTHYLDRLIPESIGMVTTFEHAKTLVVSVRQELGARLDDDASKEVRAALITEFDKALSDADEARRLVSRELQSVTGTVGTLTRIIDEYGRQLQESERGRLAVLETDIAAASKGMTDAVEQTVKSGRKIGAQVKKLVTWIMSLFGASGDADDTPKDKQDDGDKDKDKDKPEGEKNKSEKKSRRPTLKDPGEPFPGETIGEISDETSTALASTSDLNRHAAKLEKLYVELYTLHAALGAAVLIKQQGIDYLNAVRQLDESAADVSAAWKTLAGACREAGSLAAQTFDASWEQLERRIGWIRDSLTGGSAGIPQLARKDNVVPIHQPGEGS